MNWVGWMFSSIGAVGGVYSTVRVWRFDRERAILAVKWEFVRRGSTTWLLTNRQPRTVFNVTVTPSGIRRIMDWPDDVVMRPNEGVPFLTGIGMGPDGPVTVTWTHRPKGKRIRSWSAHLPSQP